MQPITSIRKMEPKIVKTDDRKLSESFDSEIFESAYEAL